MTGGGYGMYLGTSMDVQVLIFAYSVTENLCEIFIKYCIEYNYPMA